MGAKALATVRLGLSTITIFSGPLPSLATVSSSLMAIRRLRPPRAQPIFDHRSTQPIDGNHIQRSFAVFGHCLSQSLASLYRLQPLFIALHQIRPIFAAVLCGLLLLNHHLLQPTTNYHPMQATARPSSPLAQLIAS
ncbi:hypothetical protein SLA2020_284830 [Shorea laevis]